MIWYAGAAAAAYGALWLKGAGRSWLFWLAGIAAFAVCFRGPSPLFLALFMVPTLAMGVESLIHPKSGAPRSAVLMCALSDLFLAIAFTVAHADSFGWTVPRFGGWAAGAALVIAAGAIRCASAFFVEDLRNSGLVSLAWWQGIALSVWVGKPSVASTVLIVAVVMLVLSLTAPSRAASSLMLGSGVVLMAVSVHPQGRALAVVIGLAASALIAGGRAVSAWVLAALPLSLLSVAGTASVPVPMLAPVAWLPGAATVATLNRDRGGAGGELLAAAAVMLTVLKVRPQLSVLVWLAAAVTIAAAAAFIFNRRYPDRTQPDEAMHIPMRDKLQVRVPSILSSRWVLGAAGSVALVASLLIGRLAILGLSVGFLQSAAR